MIYVIDTRQRHVAHEATTMAEAESYVETASYFGGTFEIVIGAHSRDVVLTRMGRKVRR